MAYIRGPDLSDSDFSDDDDYVSYGEKYKKTFQKAPSILTAEEKLNQEKNQLYNAICSGKTPNVLQFIDNGIDVNINLHSNWTPLLVAVSLGNAQLTEKLLERGADPNSTRDGCTALMMASNCPKETSPFKESLMVIKQLVEKGADIKATNRKRMNALMFAANAGNLPAVKYLLPLCDKNAEDNQKWTALFWAVNNNEVEVFKYLLEEQLDYMTPDIRNNTPLDIAKTNDFTEIVELFPSEETDDISNLINANILSYEEIFKQIERGKDPAFFLDICDMLCGMKSEALIKKFAENDITLHKFLSLNEQELEELDINMPYQRYRILAGIHKFHKHPFHPKSLHVVPLNETYSNIDIGIQILSAIKQLTVMEAGLIYVMKHIDADLSDDDLVSMRRTVETVKKRIQLASKVTLRISEKTKNWDRQIAPADLITKESRKYKWPWRNMILSIIVISSVIIFKLKK